MKRDRLSARPSMKLSSSCWPPLRPSGSVTFSALFLPLRSTTRPLSITTRSLGSPDAPSRLGLVGAMRPPPSAQAMASRTLVLPCPLRPPITVRPSGFGSM